jgi:Radical SAM superfamily
VLRRLPFVLPRRDALPALDRYARLLGPTPGEERTVGYVEASRGCLHRCLHCPITPVYDGRFFVVPREIVLADAAQQIAAGARHITFGDPDFFNGVGHSMAIARALSEAHPGITFDVTAKVEHLLKHRDHLPELARLGCVFIVSAVESLSDRVLAELDKGHTSADVREALRITRAAGVAIRPSLVAFTPWTTLDDYLALCDFIVEEGLEANVDPIQLAIRLLIPPGSALLAKEGARPWLGPLVPEELGHGWTHPDPAMDRLFGAVSRRVEQGAAAAEDATLTFAAVRALAYAEAGREPPDLPRAAPRPFVPRLTEPWFCCAEPTRTQLDQVAAPACGDGCCP